jgi:DNA replication licensing factor MCM5
MKYAPKISEEAGSALQSYYVEDRKTLKDNTTHNKKKNSIPITVRQLEAIIRMSESLAKMTLSDTVTKQHVQEAHRLFQESTLSAAKAGTSFSGYPSELTDIIQKIEESIKRRLAINSKASLTKLIEEIRLNYSSDIAINYV